MATRNVIKWGQMSAVSDALLREQRGLVVDALGRRVWEAAAEAGHDPIPFTVGVLFAEPWPIDDVPEGHLWARASVRCIEGGAS
jgi:hypothetical protein